MQVIDEVFKMIQVNIKDFQGNTVQYRWCRYENPCKSVISDTNWTETSRHIMKIFLNWCSLRNVDYMKSKTILEDLQSKRHNEHSFTHVFDLFNCGVINWCCGGTVLLRIHVYVDFNFIIWFINNIIGLVIKP